MEIVSVNSVADKAREGVKWSILLQFVQKAVFFIGTIIIARILTPADFGTATMAVTFDTITWLVLSLGINSAVVHFQDNINERLNAAFWLFMISAMFFVCLQIIAAPYIAAFYKVPILADIVRVNALSLFILSFAAIQRTAIVKSINFKKVAILDTINNTIKNLFYIIFALSGFGVWSFIYPKIIYAVTSVISIWIACPWRPDFKLYFRHWGEMLKYGKNVLFSSIIDYLLNNSSYILIGSMIGSTSLGFYTFAYERSMIVVNSISTPFTNIAFPAFSRLQDHKDKLKDVYLKSIKTISLAAFPFWMFILVMGSIFINFLYGSKWNSSIIIFQVIMTYSTLRTISQVGNPLFQAIGKPEIPCKWNMVFAPIYFASIYIGYKFDGMMGIAILTSIVSAISAVSYTWLVSKVLNWQFSDIYRTLAPSFVASLIAGIGLFAFKEAFIKIGLPNAAILFINGLIGLSIYFSILYLMFKDTFNFIVQNVKKLIKKEKVTASALEENKA